MRQDLCITSREAGVEIDARNCSMRQMERMTQRPGERQAKKPSPNRGRNRYAEPARIYNPSMEAGFQCAGCGEWNETGVDESAGSRQSYVEDCQVCCRPNVLRAEYDIELGAYCITAELESS